MSLPKIHYPIINLLVPSLNSELKFRPYLVKEEKILLTAQASGDKTDIIKSLAQIINNCCLDELAVDDLSTFDIEYLFIKLRAKSVNNIIEVTYKSPIDDEEYKINVDLDTIVLERDPTHSNKIAITDGMEVVLKYPKPNMMEVLKDVKDETDAYFKILSYCLHYVVQGSAVTNMDELSFEEKEQFLEGLDITSFRKLENFLKSMPKVVCEVPYKTKSGEQASIKLEGLEDFFTFR